MTMNSDCRKFEKRLPDLLLGDDADGAASGPLHAHLAACPECAARLDSLRSTMSLLDEWQAPEISPYFDSKLAARLRSEKSVAPAGFLERLQSRLMFGNLHLKTAAAVAAFAVILGGGSYAGYTGFHQTQSPQSISATVNDLQILDHNDQVINQLDVLDDAPDSGATAEN